MRCLLALTVILGLGGLSAVRADLAPPVPAPQEVKLKVELDENAKGAKLIIPAAMVQPRFRPRPQPLPGKKELPPTAPPPAGAKPEEPIEVDNALVEWEVEPAPTNRHHVLIAGLALTLSLSLGGAWLMRRHGRGSGRALVLFVASSAALAGSTVAWANAPPPRVEPKPVVALPTLLDGKVNLEVVIGGGDSIRLVLDKATFEKLKEAKAGK